MSHRIFNWRTAVLVTSIVALAACATTPGSGTSKRLRGGSDCIFQSGITSFTARSDTQLLIHTGRDRDVWVAEVAGGCWDLERQISLALVDGDGNGSICGFGRDAVAYRGLGGRVESCRILSLQRLDDAARRVIEGDGGTPERKSQGKDEGNGEP